LLALFPTLIGLLPMVGGAMFSAPMVEEASRGLNLSPERKTFVNYWFRHAWESIFPLYPSLVLAAGLMGATAQTLAMTQWPLFLATVAGGILLGLVGIAPAQQAEDNRPGRRASVALLARSIWPIVLLLSLSILLDVDLIVSLVITLVILVVVHRLSPRRLWDLARAVPLDIVPIIVGTMVFQQILESSGTVESVSSALTSLGIPTYLVVFAVPFIAGLMTGLAVAAFAIGFPIVLPLCGPDIIASGCGLLAYAGGFTGLLLSPVHLCLTLTRTYFQAEWGRVYRFLLPGALLIAAAAAITMWLK
jgi:integral membrane protein (TIGR00529 family)